MNNKALSIILFNIIMCILPVSLHSRDYFGISSMPIEAEIFFCKENKFLLALNIDENRCSILFKKYSKECLDIINPLIPTIDINKSKDKTFSEGRAIGNVYILCLKSYVYEDVFGIPSY